MRQKVNHKRISATVWQTKGAASMKALRPGQLSESNRKAARLAVSGKG